MAARPVLRVPRSVPRAGAALVVLLAALVHLLGCAHGPASYGAARADTLLAATASSGQAPAPPGASDTAPAAPSGGGDAGCWGEDEATAQPPRGIASPVPVVDRAAPSTADSGVLPAEPGPAPDPARESDTSGRSRAHLGVWRT
ncbi:hypothetical protein [Streptomyces sp. NPDC057623]|uniref:hypothetical protein n=1 Tax=Streptomyces sp. NPDC057623 TaxID=3346187 RepID=UPI00368D4B47